MYAIESGAQGPFTRAWWPARGRRPCDFLGFEATYGLEVMPKRAHKVNLPRIRLRRTRGVPLYQQVYAALRDAILQVRIAPGDRLPSTRTLAQTLGVSRNTVEVAYEQLLAEGFLKARVGSGTRAARATPETYLRDLPLITKDALGQRGKPLRRIALEACYPSRVASLADPDGNPLHLFES